MKRTVAKSIRSIEKQMAVAAETKRRAEAKIAALPKIKALTEQEQKIREAKKELRSTYSGKRRRKRA